MSRVTDRFTTSLSRLCWLALLALSQLLAGCANLRPDPARPPAAESSDEVKAQVTTPVPVQAPPASATAGDGRTAPVSAEGAPDPTSIVADEEDVWARIAVSASQLDCARLDARSARWRDQYAREAQALGRDLQRARPLIELVVAELQRRGVPLQFAMLPMVESQYRALPAKGNRPAGMWQLMPRTARGMGVSIQADYDGRLDYLRSTEAAVALLAHLNEQFDGDWRLSNMAFNAGEFRIKSALKNAARKQSEPKSAAHREAVQHRGRSYLPDSLGLSKITLHHLAKVEALNCILASPAQFGVALPTSEPGTPLDDVALAAPLSVGFLAHLAGMDLARFRAWNPAVKGELTPAIDGLRVLMPAPNSARALATLNRLPLESWSRWGLIAVDADAERERLLDRFRDQMPLLEAINDPVDGVWPNRLWLPLANTMRTTGSATRHAAVPDGRHAVHVIRPGETLWGIARRYGLALKNLMAWNGLGSRSVLKPGQSIRLRAPL